MAVVITIVYTTLLLWGFWIGVRQIYQGFRRPERLLNPLFANRTALVLFTVHIVVASCDLLIIGPLAVAHKSPLWYWGGRIALLTSSLPIAVYLNRNSETFGRLIGRWVTVRNLLEYALHVVVAAWAVSWFAYYLLLWWLVGYRYLDVGPRRALQKLYNSESKLQRRPWAPVLNWSVTLVIYVFAFVAVYAGQVLFASPPPDAVEEHIPAPWEIAVVVGFNVVLLLFVWLASARYVDTRRPAEVTGVHQGATGTL